MVVCPTAHLDSSWIRHSKHLHELLPWSISLVLGVVVTSSCGGLCLLAARWGGYSESPSHPELCSLLSKFIYCLSTILDVQASFYRRITLIHAKWTVGLYGLKDNKNCVYWKGKDLFKDRTLLSFPRIHNQGDRITLNALAPRNKNLLGLVLRDMESLCWALSVQGTSHLSGT